MYVTYVLLIIKLYLVNLNGKNRKQLCILHSHTLTYTFIPAKKIVHFYDFVLIDHDLAIGYNVSKLYIV